jgi:hypothetical protein
LTPVVAPPASREPLSQVKTADTRRNGAVIAEVWTNGEMGQDEEKSHPPAQISIREHTTLG